MIFNDNFHNKLCNAFNIIPEERRTHDFINLIPEIARSRQLPNIYEFDNSLPENIKVRVNRLYKNLASLDFRRRTISFEQIFTEVSTCELILAKEAKYRMMIAMRRKMHGD